MDLSALLKMPDDTGISQITPVFSVTVLLEIPLILMAQVDILIIKHNLLDEISLCFVNYFSHRLTKFLYRFETR